MHAASIIIFTSKLWRSGVSDEGLERYVKVFLLTRHKSIS